MSFKRNNNFFNFKIFLIIFFLLNFIGFNLFAAFDSYKYRSQNTRARGMGASYTAVSGDAGSMFYNNAGLAFLQNPELYLSYAKILEGLDEDLYSGYSSLAIPLKNIGTFGLSYNKFNADIYNESVFNFSYARKIFSNFSFGVGGYLLEHSYDLEGNMKNDPLFKDGDKADGYSVNFGLMYELNKYFTLGFSGFNLNRPDVGIKNKDIVYDEYALGFAFKYDTLLIPIDLFYRNQDYGTDKEKLFASIGVEKFLTKSFAIRLGLNDYEYSVGFSLLKSEIFNKLNLGIDYSFSLPKYINDNLLTHQLSLSFKFGDLVNNNNDKNEVLSKKAGIHPKFKLRAGVDKEKEILELLFDEIIVYRFYGENMEVLKEKAKVLAKSLSYIMSNEVIKDEDFFVIKENDSTYVSIKNLLKIPVIKLSDNSDIEKDVDVLLNKLKYILVYDWNKNQPITNISRRIKVKKGITLSGEIGIIFIDNEPIFNIYTGHKGKGVYETAIHFASIINRYLRLSNHRNVSVYLDRKNEKTIFLDKQKLFNVSKDAEFLRVNPNNLAKEYLKKLRTVFEK